MKLILADGTVIECDSITLEPHCAISCPNRAAFLSVWDSLTPENLDRIQIVKGDAVVAVFRACDLIGTQTVNDISGSMIAHFYFDGEAIESVDPEYKEAYNLITGTEESK